MSSMPTTLQQVQVYLRDTLTFFHTHIKTLALLVLPYAAISEIVHTLLIQPMEPNQRLMSSLAVEMILSPILQSVLILFMAAVVNGHQKSVKDCYQYSVQFWPRLLILSVLFTMGVMSGLSLFIVPGIYLMIRLTMSDMFCVLDNQSVVASIRQSFEATVPVTWVIFLGLAMLFPAVTTLTLSLSHVAHSLDNPFIGIVISVVQGLLHILYSIYLFRVFSAIRAK